MTVSMHHHKKDTMKKKIANKKIRMYEGRQDRVGCSFIVYGQMQYVCISLYTHESILHVYSYFYDGGHTTEKALKKKKEKGRQH
jgi:hypothetical protein